MEHAVTLTADQYQVLLVLAWIGATVVFMTACALSYFVGGLIWLGLRAVHRMLWHG